MVEDSAMIAYVGAAIAGYASGWATMTFYEQQTIRSEQRQSDVISAETKAKLAANFLEDVAAKDESIDDTIANMEKVMNLKYLESDYSI